MHVSRSVIDWSSCTALERDPQRMSGVWLFRGTRVPFESLFQNLEDGADVADFVRWFPGVVAEDVRTVLQHVARSLQVGVREPRR